MLVLLDLWGVLLDSRKMNARYPERLGRLLSGRYGGPPDAWTRAHHAAHAWYVEHMDRPDTWAGRRWLEAVNAADAEYALRLFRDAGFPEPDDPLGASRALEFEVTSGIDTAFPDARPAMARLRAAGHRVCVATNATEPNARGSLTGARLLDAVEAVFTGELLDGGKQRPAYWTKIQARFKGAPNALIVDDRLDYLEAAAATGLTALLLDREGRHPADRLPSHVHASLRNLAGLPHFVDLLETQGSHTSK